MPVFLVDRYLPGADDASLAGAQRAAMDVSRRFSADGRPLRYLRSTFIPGEERCLCLFEATDAATVAAGNADAGLPFTRIVQASDLPAPQN